MYTWPCWYGWLPYVPPARQVVHTFYARDGTHTNAPRSSAEHYGTLERRPRVVDGLIISATS